MQPRTSNSPVIDERSMAYAHTLARLVSCPTVSATAAPAAHEASLGAHANAEDVRGAHARNADAAGAHAPYGASFETFRTILREEFPTLFATCEEEDFEGNMLLRWPGSKRKLRPVLFMNHMDVSRPGGSWSEHGPFSGDIAGGAVWGRGTLESKSGLFGMLQAANELAVEGFVPRSDIYFESSVTGETDGSGALLICDELAARGIRFRFCLDGGGYIVHDPIGGANADFAMVGLGEKHLATLKITAVDKGGCASAPGADTGLVRLARFISSADAEAKRGRLFQVKISPTVAVMLRRMAPTMDRPLSFLFAHPRLFSPLLTRAMPAASPTAAALLRTTIAFTKAEGSDAYNMLPTHACVYANMRCSRHQGLDESIRVVRELASRHNLDVDVVEYEGRAMMSNCDSEGYRLLEDALHAVFPKVIVAPYVMTGLSDSRFMDAISDACLRFAPYKASNTQVAGIHGPNENIDIAALAPGVDVYKHLMRSV